MQQVMEWVCYFQASTIQLSKLFRYHSTKKTSIILKPRLFVIFSGVAKYIERLFPLLSKEIMFKHILPNSLGPVITFTPFVIAGSIAGLAALDYLGFGLEVPTPSWGELLSQGKKYSTIAWWLTFFPSLALCGSLIAVNGIGEGVRDAMDPNLK